MLALVVAAVFVAFFATGRVDSSSARYGCPMHTQVVLDAPGRCPICGMALERLGPGPRDATSLTHPELRNPLRHDITVVQSRVFTREIRAPGWLERPGIVAALVYNDEVATLAAGERGSFVPTAAPADHAAVRLTEPGGERWDDATAKVRFELEDGGPAMHPGEVGWVTLAPRQQRVSVVPHAAILWSAGSPYVLAVSPDGLRFDQRPVEIGKVFFGLATVISGVTPGERIAGESAFLMAAEKLAHEELKP